MSTEQTTTPAGRWLITGTGMVASSTMVLSGTIVNVAVPDVMGAFGVGQGLAQFVATAFLATMTASQLLGRWIIGLLGRRIAFMTVLVVFAAGGLVCATSPSIDFLIFGRVMQGFSAGIVQPLVLVTILSVFPPERRGMATGIYLSGLALALGFGPVVGGLTIDALGWRYIFSYRCRSSRQRWCSARSSCRRRSIRPNACRSTGWATHCCACHSSA